MNKTEFLTENAKFKTETFGKSRTVFVSTYPKAPYAPSVGEHPRVLYKKSDAAAILRAMELPESKFSKEAVIKAADTPMTGILPDPTEKWGKLYNYDGEVLFAIRAKALMYVLTGKESYGYEAVIAMKNVFLSLNIIDMNDKYRPYGHTVFTAAAVYDACHDLMTDEDREQFVRGAETFCLSGDKMEIGFPPVRQSPVSSHGSEAQLMRDYLAFSIAIYDEYPDWWELVGGRFFAEYVPFRNIYFASGIAPQGVGLYGMYRHNFDLWSAWIIKVALGFIPYSGDCERVVPSFLSAELPLDGEVFPHGDYYGKDIGLRDYHDKNFMTTVVRTYGVCTTMIHSGLYRSSTSRATGAYYSFNFTEFLYENNFFTPMEYVLLTAMWDKTATDRHEGLPTVLYNSYPVGMFTAREAWGDPDSAAVFMKIGERTTANHDHEDAGSFQIYYKGWLTRDSGCYSGYGSDQHLYYHQATVGHNSLLVYNPAFADTCRGRYSGGQNLLREAGSIEQWQTETYHTGDVYFADSKLSGNAYSCPDYVYLDGDIAPAYSRETVEKLRRRMFSVFTHDEKNPLLFAVMDEITATDPSFEKTFLLHAKNEPKIMGKTVVLESDGGKLTMTNLQGCDKVTSLGGEGQHYVVRGVDVPVPVEGMSDEMWGRVELSPKVGNKTDVLVNFMVVGDKDATAPSPEKIETADFVGCTVENRAILFKKDTENKEFTLPDANGECEYYLLGMPSGIYTVTSDLGEKKVAVGKEKGVLNFKAAGKISVLCPET